MNVTTALPSEQVAVCATVDPDVLTAAAHTSDYVDASEFNSLLAIVAAGTLGASATFDAKLVQATDSSGTGSKDITGKSITQLTQAGTDESDRQALINVSQDELDLDNGFTHVALTITVGTASSDGGGVILGISPRNGPANLNDLASVAEIVN
jgi:hypothetical protein